MPQTTAKTIAAAAIQPADHKKKKPTNKQRLEALDAPTTFTWDGEEWTVTPSDATRLEFLEALEDERMVTALRILMGREQASRLVKGRKLDQLVEFFDYMGEEFGTGNS